MIHKKSNIKKIYLIFIVIQVVFIGLILLIWKYNGNNFPNGSYSYFWGGGRFSPAGLRTQEYQITWLRVILLMIFLNIIPIVNHLKNYLWEKEDKKKKHSNHRIILK